MISAEIAVKMQRPNLRGKSQRQCRGGDACDSEKSAELTARVGLPTLLTVNYLLYLYRAMFKVNTHEAQRLKTESNYVSLYRIKPQILISKIFSSS